MMDGPQQLSGAAKEGVTAINFSKQPELQLIPVSERNPPSLKLISCHFSGALKTYAYQAT